MAARRVNTPGATPKPEEVKATEATQPTTAEQAEQAEAALESITGADPSTNENAPEVALVPVEQFDAVAQKLAEVEATEATQPTTAEQAEQAEAALESITGADPSTNENAPEVALVPVEQFDAVAQKLAEVEAKIKELEAKSKASTKSAAPQALESKPAEVKRTQNVLTERGWDSVEG